MDWKTPSTASAVDYLGVLSKPENVWDIGDRSTSEDMSATEKKEKENQTKANQYGLLLCFQGLRMIKLIG